MSDDERENFFYSVRDLKLNGSRRFAELENSILDIQTAIAAYIKAFEGKTKNISLKVDKAIEKIDGKE